jgi:hypothetical protein
MADSEKHFPQFKIADEVRVKIPTRLVGLVSEVTWTSAGSGEILYRVRIPMDPDPLWMLLRESEIEAV